MKKMTNDRLMKALAPLTAAKKDARLQLRHVRIIDGYAYATDGQVWAKIETADMADGFYERCGGGYKAADSSEFGRVYAKASLESILPDKSPLSSAPSDKLVGAVAAMRKIPKAQLQRSTVLQIGEVQAVCDTANLLRTVKAVTAVCGDSFTVEIYPMGDMHIVLFRCGGNIAMLAGLRGQVGAPYIIVLAN